MATAGSRLVGSGRVHARLEAFCHQGRLRGLIQGELDHRRVSGELCRSQAGSERRKSSAALLGGPASLAQWPVGYAQTTSPIVTKQGTAANGRSISATGA